MWTNAEIAVTIMAASVPILRVLLKNSHGAAPRGGAFLPQYKYTEDTGFDLQSRSTVIIESRGRRSTRASRINLGWKREEVSESRSSFEEPPAGKVLQIHEVAVEFEEKTDWNASQRMPPV